MKAIPNSQGSNNALFCFFVFVIVFISSLYNRVNLSIWCLQLEEAWLDDEHTEFLEELKMEMLEEQRREEEEMERAARDEEEQVGWGILLMGGDGWACCSRGLFYLAKYTGSHGHRW